MVELSPHGPRNIILFNCDKIGITLTEHKFIKSIQPTRMIIMIIINVCMVGGWIKRETQFDDG